MRLPSSSHQAGQWRISEIAPDFTVEDVWALPARGRVEDFDALVDLIVSSDPANADSVPTRLLWRVRDLLGRWFDLGRISVPADPGTSAQTLVDRLPPDLRDTTAGLAFVSLPFMPLYRTDTEFAAEVSNRTVHAVMHLAWVDRGVGLYEGQMAVYVKPRGLLGKGYMALIKPFRHWVVYPALLRQIEREWNVRVGVER